MRVHFALSFRAVERRVFIRSGPPVWINTVGLNRYSVMVLGIVRPPRPCSPDGCGSAVGQQRGDTPSATEVESYDAVDERVFVRSAQTSR